MKWHTAYCQPVDFSTAGSTTNKVFLFSVCVHDHFSAACSTTWYVVIHDNKETIFISGKDPGKKSVEKRPVRYVPQQSGNNKNNRK